MSELARRDIASLLARPARLQRPDLGARRRLALMLDSVETLLDPAMVRLLRFHLGLRPVDLERRRSLES